MAEILTNILASIGTVAVLNYLIYCAIKHENPLFYYGENIEDE